MTWLTLPDTNVVFTQARLPDAAIEGVSALRDGELTVIENDYVKWLTLRKRGLLVPFPYHGFKFRGRFTPRAHQKAGFEFLLSHQKAALIHPCGAGKSLTTLWALDYLFSFGLAKRVLIVAPMSVCTHVWQREIFLTFPHLRSAVIAGSTKKKNLIATDPDLDILIVNYESLHFVKEQQFDVIVADEATKIKTVSTKAHRTMAKLSQDSLLWLLTGTPTPQGPMDAYGLIRLLRGNILSKTRWQMMTMRQITQFKWVELEDAARTVAQYLQPAHHIRAEDCYDVPDVEVLPLEYDLTPEQTKLCKEIISEARTELNGKSIDATNAAHALTKLLQIHAGGVYGEEKVEYAVPADDFFSALLDLVRSANTPVLIFCSYKINARAVERFLVSSGVDTACITGDTPVTDRSRIFDDVQSERIKALVAVPTTMSHGITLTASRYVVWLTPPFSNETYEQSNARVIRQGQKNSVKIYHMVGSPAVQRLFRRLEDKGRLQDAVMEMLR